MRRAICVRQHPAKRGPARTITVTVHADQRRNTHVRAVLPSWSCGFDSRHPLHARKCRSQTDLALACGSASFAMFVSFVRLPRRALWPGCSPAARRDPSWNLLACTLADGRRMRSWSCPRTVMCTASGLGTLRAARWSGPAHGLPSWVFRPWHSPTTWTSRPGELPPATSMGLSCSNNGVLPAWRGPLTMTTRVYLPASRSSANRRRSISSFPLSSSVTQQPSRRHVIPDLPTIEPMICRLHNHRSADRVVYVCRSNEPGTPPEEQQPWWSPERGWP